LQIEECRRLQPFAQINRDFHALSRVYFLALFSEERNSGKRSMKMARPSRFMTE
jgi:hypothetical protein